MNARLYDAETARFLSADTFIQAPSMAQNYNRYSYVMNNPLKYTDPSGHFFGKIFKALENLATGGLFYVSQKILKAIAKVPVLNTIAQAAACYYGGPIGCAAYSAASTYSVTGDLGMAVKSGAISYVGAVAAGEVGSSFDFNTVPVQNVIGNGVVGGVMSKAQGGKFSEGFIGSAFAASMKGVNAKVWTTHSDFKIHRIVTAGIIGGTGSVLGGGKFANGAASAMFTQMYNAERVADPENNKWSVIKREIADWWGSGETKDLRNGLGVAKDMASVPYKTVALIFDVNDVKNISSDIYKGEYSDAAIGAAGLVAGKSTVRFLNEIDVSSDITKSASGLVVDKLTKHQLEKDDYRAENK